MVKRKFAAETGFASSSSSSSTTLPADVRRSDLPQALQRPSLQSRGPCAPAMVKKKPSHKSLLGKVLVLTLVFCGLAQGRLI